MSSESNGHRIFIERLVIALIVIGIALLLWNLRGLFLLVFGSVLVSVILNIVAAPIRRRLGLPDWAALTAAVLIVVGIVGGAFWTFGAQAALQAEALSEQVPAAWRALEVRLDAWGLGESVREWTASLGSGGGIVANVGSLAVSVGNGIADTLLVVVGGIYLASQPQLYRVGMIKLVPERGRELAADAIDASGRALALALLAALLEFVPFIGPIVSAVPAILLAFAGSPQAAFWTALLFLAIQQFEGNVLEPLVQQRAVDLPPALLLFALVAGGLIFGIVGIILAAPLTVVLYVMVKRLYVQEALHTATRLPGEGKD